MGTSSPCDEMIDGMFAGELDFEAGAGRRSRAEGDDEE